MRNHLRSLLVICLVQVSLVIYYVSGVRGAPGVPFDDAWIHFAIARNIADFGQVSFNAGTWSGGTTSLLWDIILALGYRISGNMLVSAWVVGTIAYVAVGAAFYSILVTAMGPRPLGRWLAVLATLALSATGFMPYLALSGMDTHLFLALALGSLSAFVHRHYRVTGWLLALLMLTRIEGVGVLVVLVGATILRRSAANERVETATWLLPALIALLAYLGFNWIVTGHVLPTTMAGRKWLWGFPESSIVFSWQRLARYIQEWWLLGADFVFGDSSVPLLCGLVALALYGLASLVKTIVDLCWPRLLGSLLVVGWIIGHNLTYIVLAPIASWRHQVVNLLVLPLLFAWGGYALLQHARARVAYSAMTGLAIVVVAVYLPGALAYRQVYISNVTHINDVHAQAGRWIAANVPETAKVAAFDIGAVKYFGEREVLDLGGLTESEFVTDYLYASRVPDYIKERNATYLVMPEPAAPGQTDLKESLGITLNGQPVQGSGLALSPIVSFEVAPYIWEPFDVLQYQFYPAYRRMTVYAIARLP